MGVDAFFPHNVLMSLMTSLSLTRRNFVPFRVAPTAILGVIRSRKIAACRDEAALRAEKADIKQT